MSYKRTSTFSFDDINKEISRIKSPTICPMCNHAISPVFVSSALTQNYQGSITFFCTACRETFISYFIYTNGIDIRKVNFSEYYKHAPFTFKARVFDKIISDTSERFVKTYNQAYQAHKMELFEISGMGYRKSLEVLIKDYSIRKHPDDIESITNPKFTLKKCIDKYVSDERIKTTSIAASWIGNDETHYMRIHDEADISDLVQFIDTVVYFIQYDLSFDLASKFVQK